MQLHFNFLQFSGCRISKSRFCNILSRFFSVQESTWRFDFSGAGLFQSKTLQAFIHKIWMQNAVDYVISLPYTSNRIGFQGVSFGGSLVMFLATKFPAVSVTYCGKIHWFLEDKSSVFYQWKLVFWWIHLYQSWRKTSTCWNVGAQHIQITKLSLVFLKMDRKCIFWTSWWFMLTCANIWHWREVQGSILKTHK